MNSDLLRNEMWRKNPKYVPKIISEWYSKAEDVTTWPSVFDRFIFLWIAFEAWGTFESGLWNERMIRFVARSPLHQLFNKDRSKVENYLQNLVTEKVPNYLKDSSGQVYVGFRDPHDFPKLMETLYVVRNNLFHGHKSPTNLEDKRIIENAFAVLFFLTQHVRDAIEEDFGDHNDMILPRA